MTTGRDSERAAATATNRERPLRPSPSNSMLAAPFFHFLSLEHFLFLLIPSGAFSLDPGISSFLLSSQLLFTPLARLTSRSVNLYSSHPKGLSLHSIHDSSRPFFSLHPSLPRLTRVLAQNRPTLLPHAAGISAARRHSSFVQVAPCIVASGLRGGNYAVILGPNASSVALHTVACPPRSEGSWHTAAGC